MARPRPSSRARRRTPPPPGGAPTPTSTAPRWRSPGRRTDVARQRQLAARPAGPAADLRDRHDRQLAELVPQHAQRRVVRPAALAASAVYSATLVRSTCGTKYSGSALSSTTTLVCGRFRLAQQAQCRTSSGPIRFIGGASITTPSTPSSAGATRRSWSTPGFVTWLAGQGQRSR